MNQFGGRPEPKTEIAHATPTQEVSLARPAWEGLRGGGPPPTHHGTAQETIPLAPKENIDLKVHILGQ